MKRLPLSIILIFAVTSGLSVANIYYAQPLLNEIAKDLTIGEAPIGLVVSFTQVGYALGLFFIVPLGDLLNRKYLIMSQLFLSVLALLTVALSRNYIVFFCAMMSVGLLAVVVQVLIAFTATLSPAEDRGRAVGMVTSGIVLGVLLARAVSGFLTDLWGWRYVFYLSALITLLMTIVLNKVLPNHKTETKGSYLELLRSTISLLLEEPVLRLRASFAFFIFASFSVLWTAMVLPLSSPPYSFSNSSVGLLGLAGMAGALAAASAGGLADRGYSKWITGCGLLLLILSWVPISLLIHSVWMLVLGIIILDFAVQAVHVTNQNVIFSLRPEAHSRLVAIYMIFYSIGSGIGSISSTVAYSSFGWTGVCILGAVFSGFGFLIWTNSLRRN